MTKKTCFLLCGAFSLFLKIFALWRAIICFENAVSLFDRGKQLIKELLVKQYEMLILRGEYSLHAGFNLVLRNHLGIRLP